MAKQDRQNERKWKQRTNHKKNYYVDLESLYDGLLYILIL